MRRFCHANSARIEFSERTTLATALSDHVNRLGWTDVNMLLLSFIRASQSPLSSPYDRHSHLINMAAMASAQINSKRNSTIPTDPINDCA